ncbi:MAG TPA: serine hydrolase [Pyrinomonadaceae bacterium]|jgi:CubicO group peptidase (beta-lactamase class C family)|nr:serine hydrolase [Pyrinomonadaceae bacterium]
MSHSTLARRLSRGLLAALLFACAAAPRADARQAKAFDFAELDKAIEAELKAGHTPGAAVAVVSGDRIIYAKGFGVTSAEEGGAAVNADTLFRMGSTTKMFTAAALVTLASEGRIRLDAPVGNYARGLPPKIAALTAHQLLSQSSGLRDFAPTVTSDDDAALAKNIRAWGDDLFFTEPDRIYSYSSPNYWLAGFIVEELSGKPYSDAMRELVFKPLGMSRSTLRPLEAMTYPLALGHNVAEGKAVVIRPAANNVAKYPGGSIYSSVNELARFAVAMMNGGRLEGRQALAPLVVGELPKPQVYLPGEERAFYGYGLLGFESGGVKTVSHGGVSSGYGSTIFFAPDYKLAVIVLANRNGDTLPRTRQRAMELALPLKPDPAEQPKPPAPDADEMRRYAGKYAHAPQTWEVLVKDGKLFLKEDGKDFELTKLGRDRFGYEQGEVLFVPDERGRMEHIFMGLYAARRTP